MGPDGAGHYVKMVHNGIEYADMQLIAEAYLLLKYVGGCSNREMADIFDEWNRMELKSYLIGITAGIFREKDNLSDQELLDMILDSAGQKGTGRWTSLESLKQGVNVSMITAACNARIMSNRVDARKAAQSLFVSPEKKKPADKKAFGEQVRNGLYTAKIIAYAQGFELLAHASGEYGWNLDYGRIAAIFRAGCIIQADFLDDITRAYEKNPGLTNLILDPFFPGKNQCRTGKPASASDHGYYKRYSGSCYEPGGSSYLDASRGMPVGANLIQAQRDCLERIPMNGLTGKEISIMNGG